MSDPTTDNPAAETADKLIHAAIFDVAVVLAEAGLFAEVPVLASPVIKQIIDLAIESIANAIYKELTLIATIAIIDNQTTSEETDLGKATVELKSAHAAGDPNAIQQALKDFKDKLADLAHYNGSHSPQ